MRQRLLVGLVSLLFLSLASAFSQSVFIFYDGLEGKSEAFKSACFLNRLLGHFKIERSSVLSIRNYVQGLALQPDFLFLV